MPPFSFSWINMQILDFWSFFAAFAEFSSLNKKEQKSKSLLHSCQQNYTKNGKTPFLILFLRSPTLAELSCCCNREQLTMVPRPTFSYRLSHKVDKEQFCCAIGVVTSLVCVSLVFDILWIRVATQVAWTNCSALQRLINKSSQSIKLCDNFDWLVNANVWYEINLEQQSTASTDWYSQTTL